MNEKQKMTTVDKMEDIQTRILQGGYATVGEPVSSTHGGTFNLETSLAAKEVERLRGTGQRKLSPTSDQASLPFKEGELDLGDMVNSPVHYNKHGVECIDAIKATTGDHFISYCIGNAMKYVWRYSYKKKPKEDLSKAIWYIQRAIDELPNDT